MIEYQKILNKNLLNVFVEILKKVEKKRIRWKQSTIYYFCNQ